MPCAKNAQSGKMSYAADYHLFRALKQHLRGREFDDRRQLEVEVSEIFSSQPSEYWRKGIERLPERMAGS
ncbi:unnamed protein product [Heligmosomoides polygyrus]|uniref:Type II toxin-antitoxin system ParD family antitoxin n=1 Tax=Heligmosomoides polygyrus TaxID=6339 RepID=A0A183G1E2_HELPZ|nr:unnamed protein product [Heligmosomoides polygyrus]